MKSIVSILSLAILIAFTSCENATQTASTTTTTEVPNSYDYSALVQEVLQTSSYTYCRVLEGTVDYWIAIGSMEVAVGQTLYYNQGHEMKNFHSRELDRDFPSVFFIQDASTDPAGNAAVTTLQGQTPMKPEIVRSEFDVEKAEGGITIAELYKDAANYAGKTVKIKGYITKFNEGIMGRNWAHMQDGTEFDGNFDLTVTTLEVVNVSALVTFEGVIAIDKDFGAGYAYSVIMEQAKIVQ